MQVVINLSEEDYNCIDDCILGVYGDAIKNGTPLPNGHGDLIDRSKIAFDWWSVDGHTCVGKENIFNMPVIVPREVGDDE